MADHERHGARQPERFDPARAARLDDPGRFEYLSVDDVLTLLDAPPGARVLDFGTGTGAYAIPIARARPDLKIVALDEQPEMLALLREKLERASHPAIEIASDARPYAGAIDRVLSINVLHELGDSALRDLAALLAPGARAIFIDWNAAADRPAGPPRDHVYSPDEARARLSAAGFRTVAERTFPYHYGICAILQ